MGRIRTTYVKKKAKELFEKYEDRFKEDFEENKKILNEIIDVPSKKIRNKIAGAVTHLAKKGYQRKMEVQ